MYMFDHILGEENKATLCFSLTCLDIVQQPISYTLQSLRDTCIYLRDFGSVRKQLGSTGDLF